MALPANKKRMALGSAFLLTLAASAWVSVDEGGAEDAAKVAETAKPPPVSRGAAPRRAAPALSLPVLAEARTGESGRRVADIFKSQARLVLPPPARPAQAAVAPPAPPPLPFAYLGSMQDNGSKVVFLVRQQRLFTVRKGEIFDGQYRLEDESGNRIELVYLPLNARQILLVNGHGKYAAPDNNTHHARFPRPNPPQEGEGANGSLGEFHVKGAS